MNSISSSKKEEKGEPVSDKFCLRSTRRQNKVNHSVRSLLRVHVSAEVLFLVPARIALDETCKQSPQRPECKCYIYDLQRSNDISESRTIRYAKASRPEHHAQARLRNSARAANDPQKTWGKWLASFVRMCQSLYCKRLSLADSYVCCTRRRSGRR